MVGCALFGSLGAFLGIAIAAASAWCVLAILRAPVGTEGPRSVLATLFGLTGLGALAGLFVRRWRARALGVFLAAVFVFAIAWSRIEPSNDRPWRAEEAVQAYADIDGDRITVHNIRNFQYRTETDFTPAYYDSTFDLNHLDSVDLIAVYWMGPPTGRSSGSFLRDLSLRGSSDLDPSLGPPLVRLIRG